MTNTNIQPADAADALRNGKKGRKRKQIGPPIQLETGIKISP